MLHTRQWQQKHSYQIFTPQSYAYDKKEEKYSGIFSEPRCIKINTQHINILLPCFQ